MFLLPMIAITMGLYLVTLGLWELRTGMDRSRFITYMFSGLFLIFVVAGILAFGSSLFSVYM
ncbi:hypothetical protein N783_06175 [Pontibacillus marinus BH030004 = DSM 16465]|uniref:Uncharacterized protein n=1 Tax=Pontibacillus marinus BH030004 = DSM 16465 TaxID=1385511 RepID=A0A0A5I0S7_9BACI|nr:hypothetical protein N783_06175 [Pontibacillus marinus BH030004 = DSM 16465]